MEPVPELAAACRANHAEHPLVQVRQQAVAAPGQTSVRMYVCGPLSTANPGQRAEYEQYSWSVGALTETRIDVPATTLDEFLEHESVPAGFDVLVVDVEGFESAVFAGFDIDRWHPRMMTVELADTHTTLSGTMQADAQLCRTIEDHGYAIVAKDQINTVFVDRRTWAEAFDLD